MFEEIKKCKLKVRWSLKEVYRIVEWKNGCVYRTKSLGLICCGPDYKLFLRGSNMHKTYIFGSVSTSITKQING